MPPALDFALEALGAVPLVGGLPLAAAHTWAAWGAIAGCFGALAGRQWA